MQNRFGIKDLVLIVLVLLVGISVWLGIIQRDREWEKLQDVHARLDEQERALARIERAGSATRETVDGMKGIPERVEQIAAGREESLRLIAAISAKLDALQSATSTSADMQKRLDELVKQMNEKPAPAAAAASGTKDESWARAGGGPVQWQPAYEFSTDPHGQAGFKEGGEFTESFEAQPAKITPVLALDVYGRRIIDLVMQSLGTYDPKTLKLRGALAEAWQEDPNGLWLRAHLRPNVRFSDGTPVTAEDVRWSFHDYVMNPQIEAERDRSIVRDSIKKVTVVDERTVDFEFFEPLFLNRDNALTLFVMPKHFYSKFSPAEINKSTGLLMGSGPYKLERLDPQNQWDKPAPVVLVRNEFYWGPRSPVDRLRFKAIDNELARLTDYTNGGSDMVTPAASQFVAKRSDEKWAKENQNPEWVNMRSGRSAIIWNCGGRGGRAGCQRRSLTSACARR